MKYFILLNLFIWTFGIGNAQQGTGLLLSDPTKTKGYFLFAPLLSQITYLVDTEGNEVHSWKSDWLPAQSAYLLPDGHLLRTGIDTSYNINFPKSGGWIEKFNWNNELVWSYLISDKEQRRHHDICPLPNGNILVLVWEKKLKKEAIKEGRDPKKLGDIIWSEKIVELRPKGKTSADIVWEWHIWDHLVQDFDSTKKNFGNIAEAPELVNINFRATVDRDWLHFNSVAYDPKSDQVLISNRNFSEIFVIDHSTTTKEAAKHTGGKCNRGGDLLYRWGNPASYNTGKAEDQKLFSQHCAEWLKDSAARIIVFNNGLERPGDDYSSVDILGTHRNEKGLFDFQKNKTYYPDQPGWSYVNETPTAFYSPNVSSAQLLPNGSLFICEGIKGHFFEIDKNKKTIWSYINPYKGESVPGEVPNTNKVFKCIFYEPDYPGLGINLKQQR